LFGVSVNYLRVVNRVPSGRRDADGAINLITLDRVHEFNGGFYGYPTQFNFNSPTVLHADA
jgi:hypothetical protein